MKDRAGDDVPDELQLPRPPAPPATGPCTRCRRGWVEEFYDAAGNLLGTDWLAATEAGTIAREVTLPCPQCSPDQHLRWSQGCWRTDDAHDPTTCPTCVEDGRHLRTPL